MSRRVSSRCATWRATPTWSVVCSGSDTLHGLARSGVPVLALPTNAEQRIAATGAGRWRLPGDSDREILAIVHDLLDAPQYRAAARRLQERRPREAAAVRLAPVVAACQRRLGGAAAA